MVSKESSVETPSRQVTVPIKTIKAVSTTALHRSAGMVRRIDETEVLTIAGLIRCGGGACGY
jgi:hypothetical protein